MVYYIGNTKYYFELSEKKLKKTVAIEIVVTVVDVVVVGIVVAFVLVEVVGTVEIVAVGIEVVEIV